MTFREENVGGVIVLRINGKINTEASEDLLKKMTDLIDDGARNLLLDLSGVDYINSSGLRALLTAAKRLTDLGGEMVFAGVNEMFYQVLHVSGSTSYIKVYSSDAEAIQDLKQ